eukprot:10462410-Heterocapsa_arctica.AAC.1
MVVGRGYPAMDYNFFVILRVLEHIAPEDTPAIWSIMRDQIHAGFDGVMGWGRHGDGLEVINY